MAQLWGFHYKGKDKRGVSQWRGSGNWDRLLNALGVTFTVYGVCAAMVVMGLLVFALLTHSWPAAFNTLVYVLGIHALTFGGTGIWMRGLRKHIHSLDSADQLSARFGVNEATLSAVAQDKDIKPRMSINGTDYYNPADFANASEILLRAAARPNDRQEVLLRPATADISIHPEQLLRVPNGDREVSQTVALLLPSPLPIPNQKRLSSKLCRRYNANEQAAGVGRSERTVRVAGGREGMSTPEVLYPDRNPVHPENPV